MHAEVELHADADRVTGLSCGPRQVVDRFDGVERHGEAHLSGQRGEARGPTGADRRIGDENVVADLAHDLGLVWGRTGHADGASPQLFARDARGLVRLDVGPQSEAVCGCVSGRSVEITAEPVEVDNGNRRLEVGDRERHSECDPHSVETVNDTARATVATGDAWRRCAAARRSVFSRRTSRRFRVRVGAGAPRPGDRRIGRRRYRRPDQTGHCQCTTRARVRRVPRSPTWCR